MTLGDSVQLRLLVPRDAERADSLLLRVELKNLTARRIEAMIGGDPPAVDFEVRSQATGELVWHALRGFVSLPISTYPLSPRDSVEFRRFWPLRSGDRSRVQTGTYIVGASVPLFTRDGAMHVRLGVPLTVRE